MRLRPLTADRLAHLQTAKDIDVWLAEDQPEDERREEDPERQDRHLRPCLRAHESIRELVEREGP